MTAVARTVGGSNGNSLVEKFRFQWTADAGGLATGSMPAVTGYVEQIESFSASNHNVIVASPDGTDVLGGNGSTIVGSAAVFRKPRSANVSDGNGSLQPILADGTLEIQISGATPSSTGTTIVYVVNI